MSPWTVAHQAPLSMEFSRQEYWSGLPFLTAGDLPDTWIEPVSPSLAGGFFTSELPGNPSVSIFIVLFFLHVYIYFRVKELQHRYYIYIVII